MDAQLKSSIVRIFNQKDVVVGAGFPVSDRHVITCAQVVAEALGFSHTNADQPDREILFDLPMVAPGCQMKTMAVCWWRVKTPADQPNGDEANRVAYLIPDPLLIGTISLDRPDAVRRSTKERRAR